MQQLTSLWQSLDPRKRIIVVLATLAMFAAVYGVANLATRPSMALLYAGLDESRAGEVLAALDQRGAAYEVRGQAIYVQAPDRDALRMELASQGLPANSGSGYELLDGLSGFGTTSQMFDAAYWRAKEGELARTIAALPNMGSVRVHISNVEALGFRTQSAPKASVTVATRDGGMSAAHARALKYLVSAAVAGMKPDDVAIIDGEGQLIQSDPSDASRAGDDKASGLRENVLRMLEARVGYGKAVVEVSVETVTESEAISERKLDPQSRVAISSENNEQTSNATNSDGNSVTVASNLPTGNAGASSGTSQSNDSQTTERQNFDVSEVKRDVVRNPGAIKRLSVAVLVDDAVVTDANGQTQTQARPPEELTALRDLVAAAVGFDENRGDVITIKSLPFQQTAEAGSVAGPSFLSSMALDIMSLVQLAVLAVVSLVLGLFVVRPILSSRVSRVPSLVAAPPQIAPAALNGVVDDNNLIAHDMPVIGQSRSLQSSSSVEGGETVSDPVARLRRLISERQEETAQILRNWMDDAGTEKA